MNEKLGGELQTEGGGGSSGSTQARRFLNWEKFSSDPAQQSGEGTRTGDLGTVLDLTLANPPGTVVTPASPGVRIQDLTGGASNTFGVTLHPRFVNKRLSAGALNAQFIFDDILPTDLSAGSQAVTIDYGDPLNAATGFEMTAATFKSMCAAAGTGAHGILTVPVTWLPASVGQNIAAGSSFAWDINNDVPWVGTALNKGLSRFTWYVARATGNTRQKLSDTTLADSGDWQSATFTPTWTIAADDVLILDYELASTGRTFSDAFPLTAADVKAWAAAASPPKSYHSFIELDPFTDLGTDNWDASQFVDKTIVGVSIQVTEAFAGDADVPIDPTQQIVLEVSPFESNPIRITGVGAGTYSGITFYPVAGSWNFGTDTPDITVTAYPESGPGDRSICWSTSNTAALTPGVDMSAANLIALAGAAASTHDADIIVPFSTLSLSGVTMDHYYGYQVAGMSDAAMSVAHVLGPVTLGANSFAYCQTAMLDDTETNTGDRVFVLQPLSAAAATDGSLGLRIVREDSAYEIILHTEPLASSTVYGDFVMSDPFEVPAGSSPAFVFRFAGTLPDGTNNLKVVPFISQGPSGASVADRLWSPARFRSADNTLALAADITLPMEPTEPSEGSMPTGFGWQALLPEIVGPYQLVRFMVCIPSTSSPDLYTGVTLEVLAEG